MLYSLMYMLIFVVNTSTVRLIYRLICVLLDT